MSGMNNSASGLDFSSPHLVETPCGTPSPPNLASTQARPPPKPRRLPNVNFLANDFEGMINNLSLVRDIFPSEMLYYFRICQK